MKPWIKQIYYFICKRKISADKLYVWNDLNHKPIIHNTNSPEYVKYPNIPEYDLQDWLNNETLD